MHYFEYFTQKEVEEIHAATLQVLETVGIDFSYTPALEVLARAGCRVDGERVYFPPKLVAAQVAKAPSEFTLNARNPEKNVVIGGNKRRLHPLLRPPVCHRPRPGAAGIGA